MNIKTFGPVDERSYQQLVRCFEAGDARYAVLCADHHPGYAQPIGSAIAYADQISVSGAGFDLGCGNSAIKLNVKYDDIKYDVSGIMDEISQNISFGMGRINSDPVEHKVLDDIANANFVPQRSLAQLARNQLGTVGGGNHYVDLFVEDDGSDGYVWVGVHFGSRGFGHKTASGFLALSRGLAFNERAPEGEMDSDPVLFSTNSTIGQDYIEAMRLAGAYASAGRSVVLNKVVEIMGVSAGNILKYVENHHNFAWQEEHFGEKLWVVRKGCTPSFPNMESFIGANMADASYIVMGEDSSEAKEALYSTVHGAGRVMSRRQAAGKTKYKDGKRTVVKKGLVDWDAVQFHIKAMLKIELRGGGADEAPEVYKKLAEVLQYHDTTISTRHVLYPIGVAMAGADEYDAYKD